MAQALDNKDFVLSVSPDQMTAITVQLRDVYRDLTEHLETAKRCLLDTESFWSSTGSDLLHSVMRDELSSSQTAERQLRELVADLDQIIALYGSAESLNVQESMGLADSVLF